jgi:hypothetical protein
MQQANIGIIGGGVVLQAKNNSTHSRQEGI